MARPAHRSVRGPRREELARGSHWRHPAPPSGPWPDRRCHPRRPPSHPAVSTAAGRRHHRSPVRERRRVPRRHGVGRQAHGTGERDLAAGRGAEAGAKTAADAGGTARAGYRWIRFRARTEDYLNKMATWAKQFPFLDWQTDEQSDHYHAATERLALVSGPDSTSAIGTNEGINEPAPVRWTGDEKSTVQLPTWEGPAVHVR